MATDEERNASELVGRLGAVRQNGGMPARLPIPEGMPPDAGRAQNLLASHGRVVVIRHLLMNGAATRGELMAATGLGKDTTLKVLRELEAGGFVTADLDAVERHGRSVKYRAEAGQVVDAINTLTTWLLGGVAS